MAFENFLFLIPFLAGFVFVLAGLLMLTFPPKKINSLYGYRSRRSMKNQENWDFAQKYSSKEMAKLGFLMILFSLLGLFIDPGENLSAVIGLLLVIALSVALFLRVEKAIQNKNSGKK